MAMDLNRRDVLRMGSALGAGLAFNSLSTTKSYAGLFAQTKNAMLFRSEPMDKVRVGLVGAGGRGSGQARMLLDIEGVELRAICDIEKDRVERLQNFVEEKGLEKPKGYYNGPEDYKNLCQQNDLDLILTATPWELHTPVSVEAMKAGKHAATEVPAAVTVDQCWQLVETSEKTGKHCMMMENVCYMEPEMMVLNMVRQGLLGQIIHCQAGYLHDLRALKIGSGKMSWRGKHSVEHNANVYPTHGLGPVAQYMDIDRGDRFDYLVSMSNNSRGLNLFAEERFGKDHPLTKQKYKMGDVNVSLIKTVKGHTITLYHDCDTPRPYNRINWVQGDKGIVKTFEDKIHIEGISPMDTWEPISKYAEKYMHPLWRSMRETAKNYSHGGGDFLEFYRLIQCLQKGEPLDQNVYDAASWSVVWPLSEKSVSNKSRSVDFPDFTRGKWKTNKPLGIITSV